jgi:N-acetylmuramoyl-L-alanine amidase
MPLLLLGAALAGALLPASAPAMAYEERLYDAARRDASSLLASERSQRFRDRWESVIGKFQAIADRYPAAPQAPDALYQAGDLWRRLYKRSWLKDDLESARRAFERVARAYPRHALADDALLARADVLETLGRKKEAYQALQGLLSLYARRETAEKARARLADLSSFAPAPRQAAAMPRGGEVATPAAPPTAAFATVTEMRAWSNPEYTRVVIYASSPVKVTKRMLPADEKAGKSPRLFLDLSAARLARGLGDPIPVKDGLLRQVRSSQNDADTVRVVLDLDSVEDHLLFTMDNPFRVVLDVTGKGGRLPAVAGSVPLGGDTGEQPLSLTRQMGLGVKVIAIDPGHGGRDPGAIGPTGVQEKDVNLALARKLREILQQQGFQVHLTRENDVFIPLEDRPAFARDQGADLFISLHCNANRNRAMRGIATYFLGVAKDRESSEAAMLENAISENTMGDLEQILLDLARATNLRESSSLAESIQAVICREVRCRYSAAGEDNGVKQAPFYVLMGTTNSRRRPMPAVLLETSFISNREEEKLLADNGFQDLMARSISGGVKSYADSLSPAAMGVPPAHPAPAMDASPAAPPAREPS